MAPARRREREATEASARPDRPRNHLFSKSTWRISPLERSEVSALHRLAPLNAKARHDALSSPSSSSSESPQAQLVEKLAADPKWCRRATDRGAAMAPGRDRSDATHHHHREAEIHRPNPSRR